MITVTLHMFYSFYLFRKVNRTEDAVRMLNRCILLDGSYAPAYLLLVKLYTTLGREKAVGKLLRSLTILEPQNPDNLAEYASWLYKSGNKMTSILSNWYDLFFKGFFPVLSDFIFNHSVLSVFHTIELFIMILKWSVTAERETAEQIFNPNLPFHWNPIWTKLSVPTQLFRLVIAVWLVFNLYINSWVMYWSTKDVYLIVYAVCNIYVFYKNEDIKNGPHSDNKRKNWVRTERVLAHNSFESSATSGSVEYYFYGIDSYLFCTHFEVMFYVCCFCSLCRLLIFDNLSNSY